MSTVAQKSGAKVAPPPSRCLSIRLFTLCGVRAALYPSIGRAHFGNVQIKYCFSRLWDARLGAILLHTHTENKCQLVLTNIYTKLINVLNPSTRPQYNLNINQTQEDSYNGLYHNMSERGGFWPNSTSYSKSTFLLFLEFVISILNSEPAFRWVTQ